MELHGIIHTQENMNLVKNIAILFMSGIQRMCAHAHTLTRGKIMATFRPLTEHLA